MSAKIIFVLCAQALFVQITFSQCISRAAIDASGFGSPYGWTGPSLASPCYERMAAPGLAYDGLSGLASRGPACNGFTATRGGGLPVTSMSLISPTGITVVSENAYDGALSVTGKLPFLSAVAMEGTVPTSGAGATDYGCGNGIIAILSEGVAPAAFAPNANAFGPAGAYGPSAVYGPGAAFSGNAGLGLGNGFGPSTGLGLGPAAGFGPAAGYAPANRLGYGGCGRGMLY